MSRPNILFISTDQQHYTALGSVNPLISTPALDRLAAEGTRFERAYCPNPTCSPTRASLITGLYPSHHGCWAIGVKLPEDVPTVGEIFKENGYESILVGKAHFQPLASVPGSESIECQPILRNLDFWRDFDGPWYGFNHVETARMHGNESHVGQHYAIWMEEKGFTNWEEYFQEWPPNPDDKYAGPYYTTMPSSGICPRNSITAIGSASVPSPTWSAALTRKSPSSSGPVSSIRTRPTSFPSRGPACTILRRCCPASTLRASSTICRLSSPRRERPIPIGHEYEEEGGQGLHGFHSHLHDDEAMKRSIASYYGMTSLIDYEIGRILDYLDEAGLAENTLVVFTSDHGHFLGQHGLIAKGAFHYEDLLRVPMIVRYPGKVPAGQTSDALQSLVDYPQTLLHAAGIQAPGSMQGVDQLGVWYGEEEEARDRVMVENRHNPTTVDLRTLITDRYKITVYRDADYGELIDLVADPGELVNHWDDPDYAGIKTDMLLKFAQAEIQREPTRMARVAGA